MPPDFPQLFAQHGWEAIEEACQAHKDTIQAWGRDYGWDALRAMRRDHLEAVYAARGRKIGGRRPRSAAGRYVMGLRRKIEWPCDAPRFWDVGLVEV